MQSLFPLSNSRNTQLLPSIVLRWYSAVALVLFLTSVSLLAGCSTSREAWFANGNNGSSDGWGWFGGDRIKGSGKVVAQVRQVDSFNGIRIKGSGTLYVKQGNTQELKIETDDNVQQYIETEIRGGVLYVGFKRGSYSDVTLKIYATMPNITDLGISGSGDILTESIVTENLKCSISGSGTIECKGKAKNLEVSISGSGDIKNFGIEAENVSVAISGSGDADVYATKSLDARVSGSGDVRYKGNPTQVKSKVSGSGSVNSR